MIIILDFDLFIAIRILLKLLLQDLVSASTNGILQNKMKAKRVNMKAKVQVEVIGGVDMVMVL